MRNPEKEDARLRGRLVKVQALSSRIPPVRAVAVAGNLYKPHACLREPMYTAWCCRRYRKSDLFLKRPSGGESGAKNSRNRLYGAHQGFQINGLCKALFALIVDRLER